MENYMRARLRDKSISDLKVILEYCKEKAKTDTKWKEKVEWVSEILDDKIEYIFE
jgi:hypothetical protein